MSFNDIKKLIASITKTMEDSEKLAVPVLAVKLHKVANEEPYDQTIIGMTKVIAKMEENKKLFITKAELKDLYTKLYSRGTQFPEYFAEELGELTPLATPKLAEKHTEPMKLDYNEVADPILSNALDSLFNGEGLKLYSKEAANKAVLTVSGNLDVWNLKASKLAVEAGNDQMIVVRADYDTPKGKTSILVPVEITKNNVLDPTAFIANAGSEELNHINIKNYIMRNAGQKLKISGNDVMEALAEALNPKTTISDAEMIMTRLSAGKEKGADFGAIVFGKAFKEPESARLAVMLPRMAETESFEEKFSSVTGMAEFKFGVDRINTGREMIGKSLASFGFKNPQISVLGYDDTGLTYAVSLNGGQTAFKVPVKIANNKVKHPELLICNGSVSSFSKDSILGLSVNNQTEYKVAAVASPQYGLKPNELIETVRIAILEENYAKAEDALNILQQSENTEAYKTAFTVYLNGLSVKNASVEKKSSCAFLVKNSTSNHQICGHTGLPEHKVYQDEHGNCHPLYRRNMDENYQGAFFMNSKIFG